MSPNPDQIQPGGESAVKEASRARSRRWRLPDWLASGTIHDWVKTVTVVVVAGWGIYTFIYKDIWLPSRAPASLVVEVEPLAKVKNGKAPPAGGEHYGRQTLNLRVTATNPTKRPLFLLPSVWWLWGLQRQPAAPSAFEQTATTALQYGGLQHAERGTLIQGTPVLATGSLFVDNRIQPGEKIIRDLPIRLSLTSPYAGVDQLEMVLIIPVLIRNPHQASAGKTLFDGSKISWTYSDQADVHPVLCRDETECQSVDLQELKRQVNQFDPDGLLFHKAVVAGEDP